MQTKVKISFETLPENFTFAIEDIGGDFDTVKCQMPQTKCVKSLCKPQVHNGDLTQKTTHFMQFSVLSNPADNSLTYPSAINYLVVN